MLKNIIEEELDSVVLVFELMINQIESKGMRNYVIIEDITDLPALTIQELREKELWHMHFDGAKFKNGDVTEIVLRSPSSKTKMYSFRLTWSCTNNVVDYEAMCLGVK